MSLHRRQVAMRAGRSYGLSQRHDVVPNGGVVAVGDFLDGRLGRFAEGGDIRLDDLHAFVLQLLVHLFLALGDKLVAPRVASSMAESSMSRSSSDRPW